MNSYKRRYDEKWNFKEGSMNELNHQIHPYPAMLMPLIVRNLLKKYGKGNNTVLLDPYVGAGTTLVEAQFYGAKQAIGTDLNPLAILISKAKTIKYDFDALKKQIQHFNEYKKQINYNIDIHSNEIHNFSIRDSWFKEKNVIELAFIQRYIDDTADEKVKLFFKVAFSVVVRSVSLTRNGEFKLYRIQKNKIPEFNPNAIQEFSEILDKNYQLIYDYSKKTSYDTQIEIYEMNSKKLKSIEKFQNIADIVITSPPYGDSHTTVAYGQFSRLANEWLKFEDANKVDTNLMGGRNKVDLDTKFNIKELDDTIEKIKEFDKTQKNSRHPAVISYYVDYIETMESVATTVKKGGIVVYVVGNRRVRNYELPTDIVTSKTFERLGFTHKETIVRDILNKRMPSKASPSNKEGERISTMTKEYIVIMEKR